MTEFIYALCEPCGDVRYIGKAKGMRTRFNQHMTTARYGGKAYSSQWIASLLRNKEVPSVWIIDEVSEQTGKQAERFWIKHFHAGGAKLTNLLSCGEGVSAMSDAYRQSISKRNSGRTFTAEHKAKIAASHIGKKASPETIKVAWALRRETNHSRLTVE